MQNIYIAYALMAIPCTKDDYNFFLNAANVLLHISVEEAFKGEAVYCPDKLEKDALIKKEHQQEILNFLEDNDFIYFDDSDEGEVMGLNCDLGEVIEEGGRNMDKDLKNYC